MGTIISVVDTHQIKAVQLRILAIATEMDLDSTVLATAIADVFAITAAVYREEGQPYQRAGIDKRLESFNDRARETFYRVRRDTVDHRVISNAVADGGLRT
jgi:hypothetical protein